MEYDVILIDATETPIERPKNTFLLREEEKAHLKYAACNEQGHKKDDLFFQR